MVTDARQKAAKPAADRVPPSRFVVALYDHWWGLGNSEVIIRKGKVFEPGPPLLAGAEEAARFKVGAGGHRFATAAEIERYRSEGG